MKMQNQISFVFDTETNGFADCSVLSISFIICKGNDILKEETRYYFPKEKHYNKHAIAVNGLSENIIKENRNNCSYPLYFVDDKDWLIDTMEAYSVSNLVAHNISFDMKFLPAEIIEKIQQNVYSTYCTMKNNSKFVGIKKGNKYKYPSLGEACKAYGIEFSNSEAHSSYYDTLKAYELFDKTRKKGRL